MSLGCVAIRHPNAVAMPRCRSPDHARPDASPKRRKVVVSAAGDRKPEATRGETNNDVHPDSWDDAEGYYAFRLGELLGGRYEVTAAHGKGVFSRVVRARDLAAGGQEVAIKIIRSNHTMYRAGKQEASILETLTAADREGRRHCVRFISSFSCSSRWRTSRSSHCDIKPDNVMVNEAKNVLKLCDFGSAMLAGANEVTPYLVSRFYRAPEVILGLPYDHPMDMWSAGCCLYELCTGEVLFQGKSNNEMLRLHMEMKGAFPKRMLRRGAFTAQHFNQHLNFQAVYEDPVTKKQVRRLMCNIKPKGIGSYIPNVHHGEDPKMLSSFKDLLDKMFVLDPAKRITVEQALGHPFITGKLTWYISS